MKKQQHLEDGWFFHNHAWHLLHEIIKLIPDDTESLLDCGAGTGIAAAVIRAIWPKMRVMVTDISEESADFWDIRNIPGIVSDSEINPYGDNRFDFVMSSHVLEHVNDPVLFVSEMIRVAKKRVVIVVPDGKVDDPTHKTIFDRRKFTDTLQAAALKNNMMLDYTIYPVYHPHINNLVGVIDL